MYWLRALEILYTYQQKCQEYFSMDLPHAAYPEARTGCPSVQSVVSRQPPAVCLGFQTNNTIFSGEGSSRMSSATRSRPLLRHTLFQAPGWTSNNYRVCIVVGLHSWPTHSFFHRFYRWIEITKMLHWLSPSCQSTVIFQAYDWTWRGDTSYALGVGFLNILAHYLTVTSEKIKGWNTQWNSPINLRGYAPARLRVGVCALLSHFRNKRVLYHRRVLLKKAKQKVHLFNMLPLQFLIPQISLRKDYYIGKDVTILIHLDMVASPMPTIRNLEWKYFLSS